MSSKVSFVREWPSSQSFQCFLQTGQFPVTILGQLYCFFHIPFPTLLKWDISEFDVYRKTLLGPAPAFFTNATGHTHNPKIVAPLQYPNTISKTKNFEVVAAAVDCNTLPPSSPLRWAWDKQFDGICQFNQEFGREICSAQGINNNNNLFQNINNKTLPPLAISIDIACPS